MHEGEIRIELQESFGSDEAIANSAWTSTYNKDRRDEKYDDPDKVRELVKRLARDGHSTPFEFVGFRFWCRWPIFLDRQHMTHRIQSSSGLSGRYRTLPEDHFPIPDDVKEVFDKINNGYGKQVAGRFDRLMEEQQDFYKYTLSELKKAEKAVVITNKEYKRAREVVRGIIGTSTMVERTTMMNLRSFANYQKLRNSSHAQKEIRIAAQMMLQQVKDANVCPIALAALEENGWVI